MTRYTLTIKVIDHDAMTRTVTHEIDVESLYDLSGEALRVAQLKCNDPQSFQLVSIKEIK